MRIDDALNATKAAVEEGVVAGGGVTLFRAVEIIDKLKLDKDQLAGAMIVKRALQEPLRQIAVNSGKEGAEIVSALRTEKSENVGYNAKTDRIEDLVKACVIDPTKVVRIALADDQQIRVG